MFCKQDENVTSRITDGQGWKIFRQITKVMNNTLESFFGGLYEGRSSVFS